MDVAVGWCRLCGDEAADVEGGGRGEFLQLEGGGGVECFQMVVKTILFVAPLHAFCKSSTNYS